MKRNVDAPGKVLHLLIGTPDEDNCPICKAHAKTGRAPVGGEAGEAILVEEIRLEDVLRCPCPMCTRARSDSSDV